MDPIPGWKTKITAVLTVLFNIAQVAGLEIEPDLVLSINTILMAGIGLFLAQKIDRGS